MVESPGNRLKKSAPEATACLHFFAGPVSSGSFLSFNHLGSNLVLRYVAAKIPVKMQVARVNFPCAPEVSVE
jgi:hypothetical protein